jgi:hypothetical protein
VNNVRAAAFDPVAFEWRRLPDPPLANAANAMNRAVYVDGAVIVVGVATEGPDAAGIPQAPSQVARFDFATSQWSVGSTPPVEFRSFFEAVAAGDEVIVVGGRPSVKEQCGAVVLAYHPSSDSWRELDAGPAATCYLDPVVAWTGSELFVGGGTSCAPLGARASAADLLDPSTGRWRSVAEAPVPFRGSHRYGDLWTGSSVATINSDGTPLFFDPIRNKWHVGVRSVNGGLSFDSAPFVWAGGSIVVWSGDRGEDYGCCNPIRGGEAYVPPPGW